MRMMPIASGSSGNCIYIGSDDTHILIDAGISRKKIEEGLNSIDVSLKDIDAVFVTHEHIDHIKGLGVMSRKMEYQYIQQTEQLMELRQLRALEYRLRLLPYN